jgi:hypothetical protein
LATRRRYFAACVAARPFPRGCVRCKIANAYRSWPQVPHFSYEPVAPFLRFNSTCLVVVPAQPVDANTLQCIDSTMLPRENYLFGCTRSKSSQGSGPADLTITSDFCFSFQCKVCLDLVLRRPIETTTLIRQRGWDVGGHAGLIGFNALGRPKGHL